MIRANHFLAGWLMGAALLLGNVHAASLPAVEAQHGMVVTSQRLASETGLAILKRGGNAVDAAVAVGYALAVVNPCCGNIGGGGFMTLHLADGRNVFINFRETAPAAASANMYLDAAGKVIKNASLDGYRAVGVPGTVLGLDSALQQYGTLSRAQVMAPAIKLARAGFILARADTDILHTSTERLRADIQAARIFLHADGTPLQPGDRLVQRDLGNTLAAIARRGPAAFYRGAIPRAVERAAQQHGGVIRAADFADYRITQSTPLSCRYRGHVFLSAPPPSSGGTTLCETLNILEGYDLAALGYHSAASVHLMSEALRHAYRDRNTWLGDPAFVDNPLERLLSKPYAADIRAQISPDKATPSGELKPALQPREHAETTHYAIVDQAGNAVSTTYTINGRFGAAVMAPGSGFLLNNEMDDFTLKPGVPNLFGLVQGTRNAIAPGKRPLSSMAPTLVMRDNTPWLVLGSPGGARIISIVLQVAVNVIDYGMPLQAAVDAPRIHHQWLPDVLYFETRGLSPDTQAILRGMGYRLLEQSPWGAAESIQIGAGAEDGDDFASSGNDVAVSGQTRTGWVYGASDPRQPAGQALGD
jgi:gamma-glutamyltranspeptidase/glutathione hydrolase